MFTDRTRRITASPTQQVTLEVERLRRQGVDVVDLGAGEPDFPTPAHVKAAGAAGIADDFTRYTPNAGVPELKQAICDRYRADYGVAYDTSETIVSAGGKQALFNVAMALCDPGDEVVTHAPGWPSIVEQIKLADAEPVVVRTYPEDGFALHAGTVTEALTPRTKVIVINSPGNPTGALVSEEALATIADAVANRGTWVVLDLCYEKLIYADTPHNLPRVLDERMRDRTVLVGSLSKSYAMTGWRCGWAIGPASLVEACNVLQSHTTSNASSISQRAGIAALAGPQDCVAEMRAEYRARRDQLLAWLAEDARIQCVLPGGAFYLFPDISALLSVDGLRTSSEFATALLRYTHVALTAGEAFDAPGFLRISYAASLDRLQEGVERIRTFISAVDRGEINSTTVPA